MPHRTDVVPTLNLWLSGASGISIRQLKAVKIRWRASPEMKLYFVLSLHEKARIKSMQGVDQIYTQNLSTANIGGFICSL